MLRLEQKGQNRALSSSCISVPATKLCHHPPALCTPLIRQRWIDRFNHLLTNTRHGVWFKMSGIGKTISASTCAGTRFDSQISIFTGG
jgi:hypothetical protein